MELKKKQTSKLVKESVEDILKQGDNLFPASLEEQQALDNIFAILKNDSQVDFSHYRHTTILRRLLRRMNLCKQNNYINYQKYLEKNPSEIRLLYDDLLLYFTKFFRDSHIFDVLKETIFPRLVEKSSTKNSIRIWVPGCSTGEEVYSLAISLYEFLEENNYKVAIQIFGTDLVKRHIIQARTGLYPKKIKNEISSERLERFFDETPDGFKVIKHIREMCVFAVQNITQDPPFPKIDLVSCRNVLIYFDSILQEIVIPLFHFSLKPEGFLLLGTSETMGRFPQYFNTLDAKANLFVKRSTGIKPVYKFPVNYTSHKSKESNEKISTNAKQVKTKNISRQIEEILLATYAPPGILVDSNLLIRQFIGNIFSVLEPVSGEASLKLSRIAGESLMPDLYVAIEEAKKKQDIITKHNISFRRKGKMKTINLSVNPIVDQSTNEQNYLILFEKSNMPQILKIDNNESAQGELEHFKQRLQITKEHLHRIIEEKDDVNQELWGANEEVLSTNEELQSVNEEMEAAKEELESSNEELISLNEELQIANSNLIESKEFAENLLETANTMVVTLDNEARITTFNKYAEELTGYNKDQVLNQNWFDLFIPPQDKKNIPKVFKNLLNDLQEHYQYENRIMTKNGEERIIWWRNNLVHDVSGNIAGILSIGIDVTKQKQVENELQKNEEKFRTLVSSMSDIIFIMDEEDRFVNVHCNADSSNLFIPTEEFLGKSHNGLMPSNVSILYEKASQKLRKTRKTQRYEYSLKLQDKTKWFSSTLDLHKNNENIIVGVRDITKRKEAENALRNSEERFRSLFDNMSMGCGIWRKENNIFILKDYNKTGEIMDFIKKNEILGKTVEELFPDPASAYHIPDMFDKVFLTGIPKFLPASSYLINNNIVWRENYIYRVSDKEIAVIFNDVTERILANRLRHKSEKKYRSLFNNINMAVALHEIITDKKEIPIDFIWLDANPQYEEITKLKIGDIIGKRGSEIIPNLEKNWIAAYGKVAQTGEPITITDHSDYLDKYWEIKVYSPKKNQFAVAMIDITERVHIEQSLKQSEEQFKSLFEKSPVPLWEEDFSKIKKEIDLIKLNGIKNFEKYFDDNFDKVKKMAGMVKILNVNNAVLKLHEAKTKAELFRGLQFIFTEDSFKSFKLELIAIANASSTCKFETTIKTLTGKEKIISLQWSTVSGYESTLEKVYISTIDITDKNITEESLKHKLVEVERFNKTMIGRELKMIELKKEINKLCKKLNLKDKYRIPGNSK